jgi:hypothetical protein
MRGLLLALLVLVVVPSAARASFHLIKVREVYPAGDASYVELQMFSGGEYLVAGHHLVAYNADGSVANDFSLPSNVSASSPNNAIVLIADTGYGAAFPSGPTPDETNASLNLSAAAGAVCWVDGSPPDCVSWGGFTGPFPSHVPALVAGSPASPSGVTAGKALRRSIAAGCPTLLEASDDTDSSLADFSEQTPNPRSNASAVVETACTPPSATIDTKPSTPTKSTSASFTYHSTPAGAEFECKLDAAAFASCPGDGIEYTGLLDGGHTFQVKAKNGQGTGSAVFATWTVDTKAPTATIDSHPSNPSPSTSAAFTYHSSEAKSSFECSLSATGEADSFATCPSGGKSYSALQQGSAYTFKVRATDQAGNQQAGAAEFSWEVEESATTPPPPETTPDPVVPSLPSSPALPVVASPPPNTSIFARPPARTRDRTPTFRFSATEPHAQFQCSVDHGKFKPCRSPFTAKKLSPGRHLLRVRAVLGGSRDPSPASFKFTIIATG